MSGRSAPGSPAPSGWLAILGSWLQTWSGQIQPPSTHLPSQAGAPDAHPNSRFRVLVVDDNPVNLMLMSALMESRGVLPQLAKDGAEAAALAREMHFDLILMDLLMPILDGWEATAAIRRFESTCSRPAVPVVAYSSTPPSARVLEACGMNGILAKPCSDQDLQDCLVRWCPGFHSAPAAPAAPHESTGRPASSRRPGSSSASLR